MFRGTEEAKVDDKGRLRLSVDLMKLMAEKEYGPGFFITSRDGKVAEIWPMQEWEKEEAKKAAISEDDPAKTAWLRVVTYFGAVVEIKQDRLMLPKKIRERFGLMNADVVVTGQQRYLTVQSEQDAEREIAGLLAPAEDSGKLMNIAEARQILAKREAPKDYGN
jgi:MraZ protein